MEPLSWAAETRTIGWEAAELNDGERQLLRVYRSYAADISSLKVALVRKYAASVQQDQPLANVLRGKLSAITRRGNLFLQHARSLGSSFPMIGVLVDQIFVPYIAVQRQIHREGIFPTLGKGVEELERIAKVPGDHAYSPLVTRSPLEAYEYGLSLIDMDRTRLVVRIILGHRPNYTPNPAKYRPVVDATTLSSGVNIDRPGLMQFYDTLRVLVLPLLAGETPSWKWLLLAAEPRYRGGRKFELEKSEIQVFAIFPFTRMQDRNIDAAAGSAARFLHMLGRTVTSAIQAFLGASYSAADTHCGEVYPDPWVNDLKALKAAHQAEIADQKKEYASLHDSSADELPPLINAAFAVATSFVKAAASWWSKQLPVIHAAVQEAGLQDEPKNVREQVADALIRRVELNESLRRRLLDAFLVLLQSSGLLPPITLATPDLKNATIHRLKYDCTSALAKARRASAELSLGDSPVMKGLDALSLDGDVSELLDKGMEYINEKKVFHRLGENVRPPSRFFPSQRESQKQAVVRSLW